MKGFTVLCLCLAAVLAVPFKKHGVPANKFKTSGRIVGGSTASAGQFPYQVAVNYDSDYGSFFGGGAVIAPTIVLTAGHVVDGAKVFTLHFGANNLVTDDPNRITVTEERWFLHPYFVQNTLSNDVGIIQLKIPLAFNEYIRPISLATSPLAVNAEVIVSGWGATGDWDGVSPELNYVSLNVISKADCVAVYGAAVITDSTVCAKGKRNEGVCLGDSGGPVEDANGNLVAVVSFSSAAGCEIDHPSGFTRIQPYVSWIQAVVGSNEITLAGEE